MMDFDSGKKQNKGHNTQLIGFRKKGELNPIFERSFSLDENAQDSNENQKRRLGIQNSCPPTVNALLRTTTKETENEVDAENEESSNQNEEHLGNVNNAFNEDEENTENTVVINMEANGDGTQQTCGIDEEDERMIEDATRQLTALAGNKKRLSRKNFKEVLKIKESYYAERWFASLDKDSSGEVECETLIRDLRRLQHGSCTEKLRFLFDMFDENCSGTLEKEEVRVMLQFCMRENSLRLSDQNLDALTDVMFVAADTNKDGEISFDELQTELETHPGILKNLTLGATHLLKIPGKKKKNTKPNKYLTRSYYVNNLKKLLFELLYVIVSALVFFWGAYNYKDSNNWLMVARGGGMALNFNCAFVLVMMLRKSISFMRRYKICRILPLDHHFAFHKMVAYGIVFFTVIHTVAHVGNSSVVAETTNYTMTDVLFSTEIQFGTIPGAAFITGWVLDGILLILVLCSLPFVRRKGCFEVFYWTHMLYIAFWVICLIHGPHFWRWFVAPGVIFLIEKISEFDIINYARLGSTSIKEVNLLPSGVTHLEITKPSNFRFQPGDYVFIQIKEISQREWHPFTISSAPEVKGSFSLHIRSAGNWTKRLYDYFDNVIENTRGNETIDIRAVENWDNGQIVTRRNRDDSPRGRNLQTTVRRASNWSASSVVLWKTGTTDKSSLEEIEKKLKLQRKYTVKNKQVNVRVYLKGPYGTPTREIFDTEHAILVGAGIGVTPFASILQSIMYRYKASKRTCPKCSYSYYGDVPDVTMKLKKVDFIWINRNQKEFEWFLALLTQLEKEQHEMKGFDRILDLHMYMTGAAKKTDMNGLFLQMALELYHDKEQRDLLTGLKTKLEPGRPNWEKLFSNIAKRGRGKAKVFFCGAPLLGKVLKENCEKVKFGFSKETF